MQLQKTDAIILLPMLFALSSAEVSLDVSTVCFALLNQDQINGPMFHSLSRFFLENLLGCAENVPNALGESSFGPMSLFLEPILSQVCSDEGQMNWTDPKLIHTVFIIIHCTA